MKPTTGKRTFIGLSIALVALTIVSFQIFSSAASEEPFFTYHKSDALYFVGFATVLMTLWFQLALALIVGVTWRKVSGWWIVAALWCLVGIVCMSKAVDTWTNDMEDHGFQPMTAKALPPESIGEQFQIR